MSAIERVPVVVRHAISGVLIALLALVGLHADPDTDSSRPASRYAHAARSPHRLDSSGSWGLAHIDHSTPVSHIDVSLIASLKADQLVSAAGHDISPAVVTSTPDVVIDLHVTLLAPSAPESLASRSTPTIQGRGPPVS